MGSKTPESNRRGPNASTANATANSVDPPKPAGASGIMHDDLGGDDDDDDDEAGLNKTDTLAHDKNKKRRKSNKKKKKKSKAKSAPTEQTSPPRVALATFFPEGTYPIGEVVEYAVKNDNLLRTTAEELRHRLRLPDIMDDDFLRDYRKAAEVHRQVRAWTQQSAKTGVSLAEIAHEVEEGVRALTGHQGITPGDALNAGMGFPTGLCVNNIAAHWTPNAGTKDFVLQKDDVLKVDFGVHVNGRIVDSAFTIAFNPVYDNLLAAAKDATNTGIREAGIDARISHISECIQEAMESYEVEINGKTIPVKAIRNITGHDIKHYKIHGDKQIPFVRTPSSQRMEEGEVFAIETFGTTGRAWLRDDVGIYGYGRNEHASAAQLHHPSAKALLKTIDENFGTLVFAKRYLERLGVKKYLLPMKMLVQQGIVDVHVPLSDEPGSYVAQFEHTILLRPNCKEVVSRGDDY